ncbi:MAG TPA: amino acid adenylation domain-containing protein, partial [Longimicrobium sp.]|nr:amino acid adenylation domain-containing protein [Longimicrobium sp.]
ADLPFEKLVDELDVERSLAHTPLFQAMLVVQGAGRDEPALGGRALERLPREEEDAKFDLLLELEDGEDGIAGRLVYRAELWQPETMARMAAHLGALLAGAAAEPDRPVGTLALLDDAERRRVLVELNDTARPLPAGESLHGLFEAQARRTPGAVALVAGEERIGYRELDERANRLARHLRALGVGTDVRVGVCLGRTPSLVAAILAVLKAGGAYVPLDPAYPSARLALTLEDAGAAVLLTESHLLARLPAHGGRTVCLDTDAADIALHEGTDPGVAVPPESLAYLIYTSGSTGRPKGVAIEHRSAAAFLHWGRASFPREVLEATLFSTSVCFDLSVFELFLPLAVGARVILAENALALPELPAAGEVTLVNTVPSACAELLRTDGFPPSLRAVNLAGEPLPRALADGMAARGIPLFNLYGPSEYTTYATWTRVAPAEGAVSIGRPLANTRVYLLDQHGRPAPLGVAGELCLGGAGLARGYLGRPALTAEQFVPDPFGPAGARLYRTGDRARWAAGGELEFLGRIDHQVKVRGFRVEPGEIEAVLLRHPAVREAAVAVRAEGGPGARLVAYVAAHGDAPAAGELRAWVRERLPEFMVPHGFVFLPALPLTPSGKIDRKALPAPPAELPADAASIAPRTPAEAALAAIWAEVLERPRVGVEDNFFEAGGDSILSLRIVSRARKAGFRFTPRDLFEHPTVAALAAVAGVDEGADGAAESTVESDTDAPAFDRQTEAEAARMRAADADVEDVHPLTPLQEGLLLHSLSAPEGGAYVAQYAWELAGALDEDAFARAWDTVVERHAALRTAFLWEGRDRPLQVVFRGARMPLHRADWRGVPSEARAGRLAAWREDDRVRGFDLDRAPLLRAALIRTADEAWTLAWTHHHLVLDGWSLPLVFREVAACYAAALRGEAPALPAPPAYRDFVAWLRREDPARAEAFWRAALDGLGEPARLDPGRDRAHGEPEAGHGRLVVALTEEETERLRAFARRERLTLNTVVQGAWALLLARTGGADDVVFGATVSGRPAALPAAEETVGLFINTLPVRARVAEGERVLAWLAGLQAAQARLRDHEHTPLARVQQWSGAGDALFESVVAFENYPPGDALRGALPGVSVAAAASRMHTHYPFTLSAVPGRALELALTHARDRAGEPAAARMLDGVRTLLAGLAAAGGETRLRDLALVDGAGRAALLAWSAAPGRAPYATVHALFAAQAARTPRAVALVAGDERLTYADLDARGSRLARRLRAHGVGPDVAVGIVTERGIGMVVALLAVLKAGGAYLPLDPSYPPERVAAMLGDAAAPLVLAAARHRGAVPAGFPVVVLEEAEAAAAAEPAVAPDDGATPEHVAYVIFTSGSTGRPKGVAVPHRAIPGFFWDAGYAAFDAEQVLLQHSSTSWDALTLELWPALLTGGRCVLYPGASSDPAGLAAEVRRHGVTTLWLSAAYFNAIVDTFPEALDGVGQVMTGGEAVSAAHARRALERWPALRLVNGYGPSECTVFATCQPIAPEFAGSAVPIGAPVGDRAVHLLDGWMEPVPVGVVGEMYVGGPSVPRGYARRPALTAERLVPDPFGRPGARLYRTGDHARRLADGTLEFVGRTDHQAKVRGFRVEPGEVEAALREHPGVDEAAVLVRDDAPGGRALVAYAVRAPGADPSPAELLAFLGERLPGYLVPAAAVVLGAFPLTAHRKLDRRALPAPEWGGGQGGDPATPAEAALAAVWAEVLGVERVGTADNFFALGGDSILTFQVVARAARRGVEITPRQLFEHPTVAALARVAGTERAAAAEQGDVVGEAPLTPIQHWFFAQEIAARDHWNQALLLHPRAPLDPAPLRAAVAALLAHHDALRLRFAADAEGRWTQRFAAPDGEAPVSAHDLSALPAAERAAALEAEAARLHASLCLARGPLLRVARFDLGEGGERLLLVVHHLVVDGVSWRVLVEDLATAYDAALRGEAPRLPAKTTSFRAWAARLAGHAGSPAMAAEAAAWLASVPAGTPPVPVDFAGGENRVERAAHLDAELDEETTRALLQDVPPVYHTQANDALLAALGRTLAAWTGDDRVLVDLEGHGREPIFADVDLSRTVGWFTTLFPVALDLRGAEGPGEALVAAKERLRAVPSRGIGFGVLRWLSPDPAVRAALAALPAAGVAFNYLGQLDPAISGDQAFALADEGMGPLVHPSGSRRAHLLEVNAIVHGGRLRCRWEFATDVHRRDTVAWLAGRFLDELREIVAHCRSAGAARHTPSDFALAGIDAATLAMLEGDLLLQDEFDEG